MYRDLGDYSAILPTWLEHPGVLAYLDEIDDERGEAVVRGFILVGFYEPASGPLGSYFADLLAIAVAPEYQRRGVGTRLLDYAVHLARAASRGTPVLEIRLTVADSNVAGMSLFTKSGFRVLDENHGSYDGGQRAIRMARRLSTS